jgi:hypothetical protein
MASRRLQSLVVRLPVGLLGRATAAAARGSRFVVVRGCHKRLPLEGLRCGRTQLSAAPEMLPGPLETRALSGGPVTALWYVWRRLGGWEGSKQPY